MADMEDTTLEQVNGAGDSNITVHCKQCGAQMYYVDAIYTFNPASCSDAKWVCPECKWTTYYQKKYDDSYHTASGDF